jgi:hypothetical protein
MSESESVSESELFFRIRIRIYNTGMYFHEDVRNKHAIAIGNENLKIFSRCDICLVLYFFYIYICVLLFVIAFPPLIF